jgi:AraC family transcriptional regulator, activator of mtrCDE
MDWLSRFLEIVPVSGHLDIRCLYAAPWRLAFETARPGEIPYHIIVSGTATLEDPGGPSPQPLTAGDILLFPHGVAHTLHDGSGKRPKPAKQKSSLNLTISKNAGKGDRLDMLCGHFVVPPLYSRHLQDYLPPRLIIHTDIEDVSGVNSGSKLQLANLVSLMRNEATYEKVGGHAMLNALSAAMFALTLRLAGESDLAPTGLLALAGAPRLSPALSAMFNDPAHPWGLPELASLCNMSRATFVRHFHQAMGRSASDLLLEIRMTLAAKQLRQSSSSTGEIAEAVGYQSEAAFQRAFKRHMSVTPAQWRRRPHSTN